MQLNKDRHFTPGSRRFLLFPPVVLQLAVALRLVPGWVET
jgi:hypothetical protein